MKSIVLSVLLVFCILGLSSALDGPTDYFKDSDKADYKKLLSSSKSYLGLRNTYYTVSALKKLGQEVPDKNKVCESAKATSSDAADIFYSVAIQDIAGCTFVVNEKLQEDLKKFLTSDTFNNLYYGLSASVLLHKNKQLKGFEKEIKEGTKKLIKLGEEDGTFKTTLKSEEGTVLNGGLALLVLSQVADIVDSKTDLETVLTNAQDVFTSFSEETDDTLQIVDAGSKASNLRVTSTVFKGYVALAAALNEKPLSPDHEKIVAIAQYFVNQKQAQTTEDAYFVLEGLEAVATNNFAVPVVVSLEKSYIDPSTKEGTIKINVVNVLGKEVNSKVTINKINNGNDNKVIKSNVETDNGKFDFVTLKPEAGYYLFDINAKPSDAKYIPVTTTRKVKVIASISISETAVIVADTIDTQEDGKKVTVDFGKTTDISVQQNQVLVVNFKVQANSKTIQVQQAFLRISNEKYESIHVGRFNGKQYSVGIKVNDLFNQFYGKSGKFDLQLIVGDSFVANPIQWKLSTATIKFDNKTKVEVPVNQFAALPEIKHVFRPADKRADAALSFAFTIAVLAPALLLFVGFIRVGANFSNFPTSGINWIYALGFHGTLGAIFALYALYWLSLTMITTLQYLALLAVPYLFFASKTLNYLAGSANKSHRD